MIINIQSNIFDTAANGILDADRFQNNLFTLENIHVVTNSSGVADHKKWSQAVYNKNVSHTESGKRKLVASDLTQTNREFLKFNFQINISNTKVEIIVNDFLNLSPNFLFRIL